MDQYEKIQQIAQNAGCTVKKQEELSRYTSFHIGGPADVWIEVPGSQALAQIVYLCEEQGLPWMVLGKGSNLLIPDEGVRGVVLHLCGEFETIRMQEPGVIRCGAAASLMKLCKFAQEQGLSGLEFAWGIPGSVGGAAYMNAGAYQGEMKDVLLSCRHLTPEGIWGERKGEALRLSYRRSAYTDTKDVITDVTIKLEKDDPDCIRQRMDDYMNRRKSKQPLEYPSAGSVFKRPVGYFAGGLIEQCGLKGKRVGGAMVSEKHAGFIINYDKATCEDVKQLIALIQEKVLQETGVPLERELKILDADTLEFI